MNARDRTSRILAALAFLVGALVSAAPARGEPLRVVATVPDLADLARQIGGDAVSVTALAKGPEDPHFVEARPSFVKQLSTADLFLQVGLELELGWVPVLLTQARNRSVLPGGAGHLDASTAVRPRGVRRGPVDRSMGDVHRTGNPHYLADPRNGLLVAAAIRGRLATLRPGEAARFRAAYDGFAKRLEAALVGEALAAKYDATKLARLFEAGTLRSFLEGQGDAARLDGWLGALEPHRGVLAIADHDLWPYLGAAFGIEIVGFLEPKPGIAPTTRHLGEVIAEVRERKIPLLLAAAYYDPRHASLVERETGIAVVRLAHQVGALPGANDYLATIDGNVRAIVAALGGRP